MLMTEFARFTAPIVGLTLAYIALMSIAFAQPAPDTGAGRYVWDLSSLYANDAAWEAERATIFKKLDTIGRLKGTLGRDANSLAAGLDDPGIYSNGVIYAGNILHDDYVRSQVTDRNQRIAYLVSSLDSLKRNYFDWTLISELDTKVQDLIVKGDTPTGARISQIYLDLVREYYERDGATDFVPEVVGAEWMIESVPFLSYEHQFWPPAMATACLLVEKLRAGEDGARKGMHEVLGRGDLDLTYQLLRPIGVDLATPVPYQAVIRRMNLLMDELEKLLARNQSETK